MQPLAMRFFVCAFVFAGVSAELAHAGEITAKVPDQPLEIHLTMDGFEADAGLLTGRAILGGTLESGAVLTVVCEDNMPYLSGADCRERRKGESGFEAFAVGEVAACKFRTSLPANFTKTDYYAWPVTADHLFVLHASTTRGKSAAKKNEFDKADFEKLVASFRVTGTVDRSTWRLPPEVYVFRDNAAAHAADQLAWVTAECAARPNDFAPHFYLGELAYLVRNADVAVRGYARAAELLGRIEKRTPAQDQALFEALDTQSSAEASRKRFREALEPCERLVAVTAASTHPKAATFRAQALYNVAICHAQTGQAAPAIESLKQAIAVEPKFKERAASDELLKALHSKKEFKALVAR